VRRLKPELPASEKGRFLVACSLQIGRFVAFVVLAVCLWSPTWAQDKSAKPDDPLAASQKQLADQVNRLEALLLRSADIEALDNPTRAALLQQAVQLSKQTQLNSLLDKASKNLNSNQLSEAIDNQKSSREAIKRLLELLQSENREKRVREQRDQVRRWIEDADRLLRMQSSLRGRTEGGQDATKAAEDQGRLTNKAEQIAEDLDSENSASKPQSEKNDTENQGNKDGNTKSDKDGGKESNKDGNKEPTEEGDKKSGKEGDKEGSKEGSEKQSGKNEQGDKQKDKPNSEKNKDGQPDQDGKLSPEDKGGSQPNSSDANPSAEKQQPGQQTPGQQKPAQPSPNQQPGQQQPDQQGQQSESEGSQGSESESQQPAQKPQSPTQRAQEQIEKAQQRMKEAEESLKKAERDGAIKKQREAEENLKQAIQHLEEILKQLREEEIKRSLETLSTRLRRMLDMQNKIYEESQRMNQIAGEQPDRQILARAAALSRDQLKVATEGERAFLLLKEEGSSAAFPEALLQVNRDAAAVANRLDSGDVGKLTLVVQADIIQALEEMVEALSKIKKENEEKKEKERQMQQPGGGQGDQQQQPLINKLAELRLIRTLQIRVNKRTTTLSQMLENPADPVGQAKAKDLMEQLQELSKRQESIESVTRKTASDDKAP
jgi:hypothetical protein